MKNKTLALLAAALMLLSGCGEEASSSGVVIPEVTEGQTVTYGKVTNIAGNDLTLAVGTLQEGERGGMAPGAGGLSEQETSGQENMSAPSGQETMEGPGRAAMAEGMPSAPMEGGAAGDFAGEAMMMPGSGEGGAMAAPQPSVSLELTGEEETIRVPVGVAVYAAMGTRNISTDFTQISVDNIVQVVWDTNEEGQYIAWLQVLS